MRLKNSLKNVTYSLVGQFVGVLFSFISRSIFIKTLGVTYLGVEGLFSNVLSMLSLFELGVGPAITFSLYSPLAHNKKDKIKSLMSLYKKSYTIIGCTILIFGLALTPFIKYLIKADSEIGNLELIYALYVVNSGITYFCSYKRSLLMADQKKYITIIYRYTFFTILNILQIIVLIFTKNFILFLSCQILITLIENICISIKANYIYPYLLDKDIDKLDKETLTIIIKNIKAMILHKIGGILVGATDNVIISSFLSIKYVGYYSNYTLVQNAINTIMVQIFSSFTASIGNLSALEDNKKTYSIFKILYFFNFWIYSLVCLLFVFLINDFIQLWIGDGYTFSLPIIIMMSINFYLNGMRKSVMIFREALGLYWYDRYKPLLESIINLVVSLILVNKIGMIGVLLGTFSSIIMASMWIEPYVLYKYGFKIPLFDYFKNYIIYLIVSIGGYVITLPIMALFKDASLLNIFIKAILCTFIHLTVVVTVFRHKQEYVYIKNQLVNILSKIKTNI